MMWWFQNWKTANNAQRTIKNFFCYGFIATIKFNASQ